jgi:hypothetical protein
MLVNGAHIWRALLVLSLLIPLLLSRAAKAGDLPPGAKALPVNGYPMAYVENGSGRPLIMVHGALSDYRTWSAQMEPLGKSNRAIAVSLRHYFPERWDGKGGNFSWKQHVAVIPSASSRRSMPVQLIWSGIRAEAWSPSRSLALSRA